MHITNQNVKRETSNLECLDGHCEVVLFPDADVDLAVLAAAQLVLHGDVGALHLPLVMDGRDAIHGGLVALGRGIVQCGHQAVRHRGVVVHQLGQRAEAAFRRDIHLREGGPTGGVSPGRCVTAGSTSPRAFSAQKSAKNIVSPISLYRHSMGYDISILQWV